MQAPDTPPSGDIEEQRLFAAVHGRLFGGDAAVTIGRYRLERRLGAGTMGEVYLARDGALDRAVAVKLIHAHFARGRPAERLRREARALARLAHPNVVHVYEVDEHEGRVFLAMEYVQGGSLREWIAATRPSWSAVRDAYVAAGRGLAAAHGVGLVHRDFKPESRCPAQTVPLPPFGRILASRGDLSGVDRRVMPRHAAVLATAWQRAGQVRASGPVWLSPQAPPQGG